MLSCAGADRLQSGMRRAYGKSYGKACRVKIGDPLVSIRCKKEHLKVMLEALRRGKNKLPGRQKIAVSVNYGFTKYTHQQVQDAIDSGLIIEKGNHVKIQGERGSLKNSLLFKKLNYLMKQDESEDESEDQD